MPVEKDLISSRSDENFRKGACHAGQWLSETGQTLASEGRTATEVAERLAELTEVLCEWRSQTCEMPDGNPWDWSFKDLASVIKSQRKT